MLDMLGGLRARLHTLSFALSCLLSLSHSMNPTRHPHPLIAGVILPQMLIVAGDGIFESVGMPTPEFVHHMRENQMATMMFIFFIGNNIAQSLMNSGAFEVSYNGTPVWSKLETGRLPTWPELIGNMQKAGLVGAQL